MNALLLQDMITAGELYDGRHVPARAYGYPDERQVDAQQPVFVLPQAYPLIFHPTVPVEELDNQFYPLALAYRRHPEELTDIDDPDAADLEQIACHFRRLSHQLHGADLLHLHHVILIKPVTAHDKLQGVLTLADAASANDQYADAHDLHQHSVDHARRRKPVLEKLGDALDEDGRDELRPQKRYASSLPSPPASNRPPSGFGSR